MRKRHLSTVICQHLFENGLFYEPFQGNRAITTTKPQISYFSISNIFCRDESFIVWATLISMSNVKCTS